MKFLKRYVTWWFIVVAIGAIVCLLMFYSVVRKEPTFDLVAFKWKSLGKGLSVIMSDEENRLIGPGYISLWRKSSYVFGYVFETSTNTEARYFILNLTNKRLDWFPEDEAVIEFDKLGLDLGMVVGIGTLINSPKRSLVKQMLEM